jgi:hypothetical protein
MDPRSCSSPEPDDGVRTPIEEDRDRPNEERYRYEQRQVPGKSGLPGKLTNARLIAQGFSGYRRADGNRYGSACKRNQLKPGAGQNMPLEDPEIRESVGFRCHYLGGFPGRLKEVVYDAEKS